MTVPEPAIPGLGQSLSLDSSEFGAFSLMADRELQGIILTRMDLPLFTSPVRLTVGAQP